MYRAVPTPSKLLAKLDLERDKRLHRTRMLNVKSRIDTGLPKTKTLKHLKKNIKGEFIKAERAKRIRRENVMLVEKMQKMMRGQYKFSMTGSRILPQNRPDLHSAQRLKKLKQIKKENLVSLIFLLKILYYCTSCPLQSTHWLQVNLCTLLIPTLSINYLAYTNILIIHMYTHVRILLTEYHEKNN